MCDMEEHKRYLISKLYKTDPAIFKQERTDLMNIMKRTIEFGESDSALVIGPEGSGKSTMVRDILNEIMNNEELKSNFMLIALDGLLHVNDNIAFRDIAIQLNVDILDGDEISGSSYDILSFCLQSLQSGEKTVSKSIIFILEHIHCFCLRRNQTLLYNLFNIAQTQQVPLCVIGITTRSDVIQLMEKRVKSRFSNTVILLCPKITIEERIQQTSALLKIDNDCSLSKGLIKTWNNHIKDLMKNQQFLEILKKLYNTSKCEKYFRDFMYLLITRLNENTNEITTDVVVEAWGMISKQNKVELFSSLSVLEICLVISMCHHTEIYEGEPLNFQMIYQRFAKFAGRSSCVTTVERQVAMKAFEELVELGLLSTVSLSVNRNNLKEYVLYNFLMLKSEVKEALHEYPNLPTEVIHWADSPLI